MNIILLLGIAALFVMALVGLIKITQAKLDGFICVTIVLIVLTIIVLIGAL